MSDLRTLFWGSVFRAKQLDRRGVNDNLPRTAPGRTVPKSRRETTVRSRRLSAPIRVQAFDGPRKSARLPVANRVFSLAFSGIAKQKFKTALLAIDGAVFLLLALRAKPPRAGP